MSSVAQVTVSSVAQVAVSSVAQVAVSSVAQVAVSPKVPAAGGAEMRMRRRVAPAARARPVVPVGPTACGAAQSRLGAGHAESPMA